MTSKIQITTLKNECVSKMELMFSAIKGEGGQPKDVFKEESRVEQTTPDSCSDTSSEDIPSSHPE